MVPEKYKILGGGAGVHLDVGAWKNHFLTASYPKDARTWVAGAKELTGSSTLTNLRIFPITIYDPDDELDVRIFSEKMGGNPIAAATATVPEDYVLTGGGAQASEGSFLMASCPGWPKSWMAISKTPTLDNTVSATSTASVTAYAIGIRASDRAQQSTREIFERKMFETKALGYEGDSASCPSAKISIPPGYVLTGGGALVNVTPLGDNFLQESLIPFDLIAANEWQASSKELGSGARTIVAFAIGARVGSGTLFRPG